MHETHVTKYAARRWPVVLLCNLLDIAALDAYVLNAKSKADGVPAGKRCLFIMKFGIALCKELQENRKSDAIYPGLARAGQLDHTQEPAKKGGRCHICLSRLDKKAAAVCSACNKSVCPVDGDISVKRVLLQTDNYDTLLGC